jgi:hypothetical protein
MIIHFSEKIVGYMAGYIAVAAWVITAPENRHLFLIFRLADNSHA